ncbi:hypothetical protein [Hirschia baltica]|uniref:hypothetical protein n=1 Tax=Hirschia baltica TaxID=2724 RepID=UPI0011EA6F5D|nr:hypothetical protein [Hirschia baltica]
MSNELGVVLFLLTLIGQALVLGSVFDLVACRVAFSEKTSKSLDALYSWMLIGGFSVFLCLLPFADWSSVQDVWKYITAGGGYLLAMNLFGYEITRARSSGLNVQIALAQLANSVIFIGLLFLLNQTLSELSILVAMAIGTSTCFIILRVYRLRFNSSNEIDLKDTEVKIRPTQRIKYIDLVKPSAVYLLASIFFTIDKMIGNQKLDSGAFSVYLIAFSILMMLRGAFNFEQFFASELSKNGEIHSISRKIMILTCLLSAAIVINTDLVAFFISMLGKLSVDHKVIFSNCFPLLMLSFPILSVFSIFNRSVGVKINFYQIICAFVGGLMVVMLISLEVEKSPSTLAFLFLLSIVVFSNVLFLNQFFSVWSVASLCSMLLLLGAYMYNFFNTPIIIDCILSLPFLFGVLFILKPKLLINRGSC